MSISCVTKKDGKLEYRGGYVDLKQGIEPKEWHMIVRSGKESRTRGTRIRQKKKGVAKATLKNQESNSLRIATRSMNVEGAKTTTKSKRNRASKAARTMTVLERIFKNESVKKFEK